MSEPIILLGNHPDDYVPCQHIIPLIKPTLTLTDEEYYQAMREYEQWIDEQEQHQPDMAYARDNQEEQSDD
jgi:hypothetical protein